MDKYKEVLLQKARQLRALADALEHEIDNVFDSLPTPIASTQQGPASYEGINPDKPD